MKYSIILALSSLLFLASCEKKEDYDASGNFEADEVIVSSQQNGELLSFSANEGDALKAGTLVGQIDVTLPKLQKEQVEASIQAIAQKTGSPKEQIELINKQLAVQQAQMDQQLRERTRMQNLVKADAATRKQLDDINARIEQLEREMLATRQQMKLNTTNVSTQNRGI
ncbi:hypothetical protein ACFFJX_07740 [Pseudarcicella hirudinis]